MLNLDRLVDVANGALDIAVEILREAPGYGHLTPKGDRDYASDLDFKVERQLREHLHTATPEIGFLGEEEGVSGRTDGPRWALDPIDGTVNFVHGVPLYAVSLALISDSQPVLGVVAVPTQHVRYQAATGRGALANGRPLAHPPPPTRLGEAVVAIGDYAVGESAEVRNRARLDLTSHLAGSVLRVRMLGSAAVDLAWLAEGRLDATITLSNRTWDMAAGVVLARETGHKVVDAAGQEYTIHSSATVAARPEFLPLLLAQVAPLRPHSA